MAVGAEPSTRVDVFVNMGIIRRLREMLEVMCSDINYVIETRTCDYDM